MPAEEGVPNEVVVVVSGGEPPDPRRARAVPAGAPVVAADRGLGYALALGLDVTAVVGDLDSVSAEALAEAEAAGIRIDRHPADKDATDLELALDLAIEMAPRRILVVAGRGGRLDHELASVLLLASERYAGAEIDAYVGEARIHVVRGERELEGENGELITLLPANGAALGVTTEGLKYPLRGEALEPGSTRGVSNVFVTATARVSVMDGVLLAIRLEGER
jgi:thiamine pyrophosphokinase